MSKGSDPFYIESNYIKRVTTSWTYSITKKEQARCLNDCVIALEFLFTEKKEILGVPEVLSIIYEGSKLHKTCWTY